MIDPSQTDTTAYETPEEFGERLGKLRPQLVKWLAWMMPRASITDAEDIAQETIMRLLEKPSLYDPTKGSLEQLAFTIAKFRWLDVWRQQRRRDHTIERESRLGVTADRMRNATGQPIDRAIMLDELLAPLPIQQRSVLTLGMRGYSSREIAERLKVSESTVRNHAMQVRRKLRQYSPRKAQ